MNFILSFSHKNMDKYGRKCQMVSYYFIKMNISLTLNYLVVFVFFMQGAKVVGILFFLSFLAFARFAAALQAGMSWLPSKKM